MESSSWYAPEMLDLFEDIASDISETLHLEHMSEKVHSPHCILYRLLTQCGITNWSVRLAANVDSVSYLPGSELFARAYRVVRPIWSCVASWGLAVAWQSLSPGEYHKRVVQTPCTFYDEAYEVRGSIAFELLKRLNQVTCVYMDTDSHHIIE